MKPKSNINEAVKLANLIADDLFASGLGEARRIQLRGPNEEDLGGLCRESAVEAIATVLRRNTRGKKK